MNQAENPYSNLCFQLEGVRQQLMQCIVTSRPASLTRYDELQHVTKRYSERAALLLRVAAPYCIERVDDEDGGFIILNREYKPIGCGTRSVDGHAHYPDFQHCIIAKSPEFTRWLKYHLDEVHKGDYWAFFNDNQAPWNGRQQAERLIRLIEALLDQLAPGWLLGSSGVQSVSGDAF